MQTVFNLHKTRLHMKSYWDSYISISFDASSGIGGNFSKRAAIVFPGETFKTERRGNIARDRPNFVPTINAKHKVTMSKRWRGERSNRLEPEIKPYELHIYGRWD